MRRLAICRRSRSSACRRGRAAGRVGPGGQPARRLRRPAAPRTPCRANATGAGDRAASTGAVGTTDGSTPAAAARNLDRDEPRRDRLGRGPAQLHGAASCSRPAPKPRSTLCRPALVGRGHFAANVDFPGAPSFPARGKVLVFNSWTDGSAGAAAPPLRLQPGARRLRPALQDLPPQPRASSARCSRPTSPSSPRTSATSPKST